MEGTNEGAKRIAPKPHRQVRNLMLFLPKRASDFSDTGAPTIKVDDEDNGATLKSVRVDEVAVTVASGVTRCTVR